MLPVKTISVGALFNFAYFRYFLRLAYGGHKKSLFHLLVEHKPTPKAIYVAKYKYIVKCKQAMSDWVFLRCQEPTRVTFLWLI